MNLIFKKEIYTYTIGDNYSSINFNKIILNSKILHKWRNTPYLKCPMCELQFDCTSYPYKISEKEGNVCTTCMEKIYLDEYNFQLARANGRPRVCRNLEKNL